MDCSDDEDESILQLPEERMLQSEVELINGTGEDISSVKKSLKAKKTNGKRKNKVARWIEDEEEFVTHHGIEHDRPMLTSVDCFEKMFSYSIMEMIVDMSNMYALQKHNKILDLMVDELKIYLAILLVTRHMTPKTFVCFGSSTQIRTTKWCLTEFGETVFLEIQRYIHLSGNQNLVTNDTLAKIKDYFNMLNSFFFEISLCASLYLSIDVMKICAFFIHR